MAVGAFPMTLDDDGHELVKPPVRLGEDVTEALVLMPEHMAVTVLNVSSIFHCVIEAAR